MPNVTVSADVDSMMQAANAAAIKTVLSLNNVQNTALTTWTGAATLATVGTLTAGATGAGFTVALGTSTLTGDLPFSNFVQASAASKLVGRGSASGAGDYQEITIGTGLTMTGTTLSASASGITGADTQVLFFDGANTPAGDTGMVFNKTTNSMTLLGSLTAVTVLGSSGVSGAILSASTRFEQSSGFFRLSAPSDGVMLIQDAAQTSFNRIQLGVSTSAGPAIKRNGTGIDIRLADDSAFAPLSSSTLTLSSSLTRPGVEITAANAIGALAIDVTRSLNTKSIGADSTFTFSATPAAGTSFSLLITETGGAARVVTIPSSYSVDRQTTITTMSLGANAKAWLTWYYDGAAYQLVGDSSPNAGLATGLLKNTTTTGALSIAAAGTDYLAPGTTITLAENTSIALDPAGSVADRYTGITVTGTAGATLAFGDLIYLDPTDSRWELADANAAAAADGDARGMIGICVLAAAADGSATTILLQGIVRADTAFPALTIGAPVYVGETAGDIVVAQPVTTDAVIRIVGYGLTADEMYFAPAGIWITHT